MYIYNYSPITREYTGMSLADPSPLEPGNYLIPAHATTTAPPATIGEHEVALFGVSGEWEIVPDYRGVTAWVPTTREEVVVERVGVTLEEMGLVDTCPELTLDERRAIKMNELYQRFCDDRDAIVWVDGRGYDSNAQDIPNFLASQKRADIAGESYYKVYVDQADLTRKELVLHIPAMFSAALLAGGSQQESAYIRFGLRRDAVRRATTTAELDTINWEN